MPKASSSPYTGYPAAATAAATAAAATTTPAHQPRPCTCPTVGTAAVVMQAPDILRQIQTVIHAHANDVPCTIFNRLEGLYRPKHLSNSTLAL